MLVKISVYKILMFISMFSILIPESAYLYSIPGVTTCVNVVYLSIGVFAFVECITGKWKSFSSLIPLLLYFFVLIVCTRLNNEMNFDLIVRLAKYALAGVAVTCFWNLFNIKFVESFELVLMFWVGINLLTVLMFPAGLYQHFIPNQWGGGQYEAQWLLEQKNNFSNYGMILLLVSGVRSVLTKGKLIDTRLVIACLLCFLSSFLVMSITSVIIYLFFFAYLLAYPLISKRNYINVRLFIIVMILINIIFITGRTYVFSDLIYELTGKAADMNNRTTIWMNALTYITLKPIYGHGFVSANTMQEVLGSLYFNSTHNMVLQFLVYGGVVLLAVFLWWMFLLVSKVSKSHNNYISYLIVAVLMMIIIKGLAESMIDANRFFICFQLMYCVASSNVNDAVTGSGKSKKYYKKSGFRL